MSSYRWGAIPVRHFRRTALALVVLSTACSDRPADSALPQLPSSYDLYSAILTELADSAWYSPILVESATWSRPTDSLAMDFVGSPTDIVGPAAASAFDDANQNSAMLVDSFRVAADVELVPPFDRTSREAGGAFWSTIRRQFGDRVVVIRFSRPGVDVAGGEAVVHYAFHCGPSMCAQGQLVRFVWSEQGWIIDQQEIAWIS